MNNASDEVYNSTLAACCGPEEAFHSVELQGAEEHEPERVHVQLPSSSHISSHTPVLPGPPILLLPPLPHAIPGVAAGGSRRKSTSRKVFPSLGRPGRRVVDHIVTWQSHTAAVLLATAPLAPATPGHI